MHYIKNEVNYLSTEIVDKVSFYCNVSTSNVSKMPAHPIDYYDLTFVLKGSMTYLINGKKYVLKENDAVFIEPGSIRERLAGAQKTKYVSFNFTLNDALSLDTKLNEIINDEIKLIISAYPHSHLTGTFHSKEKLEAILTYILYEIIDNAELKSQNQHIIKILKYIESHLSDGITLEEVSKHVNLTKEYTSNLFKKEIGSTLIEYVNKRKMTVAKNMIDSGEVRLQEVASSLGFENYSYFSRLFKKYYDTSPVKRKNLNKT